MHYPTQTPIFTKLILCITGTLKANSIEVSDWVLLSEVTACGGIFAQYYKKKKNTAQPLFSITFTWLQTGTFSILPMKWSPLITGKSRHSGCVAGWEQYARIRLGWELLSRKRHSHHKWSSKQDEFAVPWIALVINLPSCAKADFGWFSKMYSGKRENRKRSVTFLKAESSSSAADF